MKPELYQNFFEHTAFPVFATDKNGKISYKNSAATKFLPMLRKNSLAEKHFSPPEHPKKNMPVTIAGHIPYTTALALQNDDDFLFLAFSRLQYGDGKEIADQILSSWQGDAFSFLITLQNEWQQKEAAPPFGRSRIHTDLLHLFQEQQDFSAHNFYLPEKIAGSIFSCLPHTFHALGYRMNAKIEANFQREAAICLCLQDFLFIFEQLLYLQMKLSENGLIHISLTSDTEKKKHLFRIVTKPLRLENPPFSFSAKEFLIRHIPEYATEILLLEKTGILDTSNVSFRMDISGALVAQYAIDYAKRPHYLRSMEASFCFWEYDISQMFERIKEKIKDNGASY